MKPSQLFLAILVLATLGRIAMPPIWEHLPNFSPISAIALFCGAYFRRPLAVILTLLSVWIGDIFINHSLTGNLILFYPGFYWQYASYALIVLLSASTLAGQPGTLKLGANCLASSLMFYLISNFGVWMGAHLYPLNAEGLLACYIAAIPFFKNTLASTMLFSAALFGAAELAKRQLNHGWQNYENHF